MLEGPSSTFNAVAMFPDGSHVVAGSLDKTVRIWDAKSNETVKVFEGHRDVVTSISISPDMTRVASGSADKVSFGRSRR
jgi:WD40 repeat protein